MQQTWRKFLTVPLIASVFVFVGEPSKKAVAEAVLGLEYRAMAIWGYPLPTSLSYTQIAQSITPLEITSTTAYNYSATFTFLRLPDKSQNYVPTDCYRNDGTPDPCHVSGFYFGVQPSGIREDGRSQGPVALFSMWNASFATAGPESTCGRFDWEGVGHFCRLDLDSIVGQNVFRVERLSDGRSWRATIRRDGRPETVIGTHTSPEVLLASETHSWLEYYGKPTLCSSVPNSWAKFSIPEVTTLDATIRRMALHGMITSTCPTARALLYDTCDAVLLGGGIPLRTLPDVHAPGEEKLELVARALGNDRFSLSVNVRGCGLSLSPNILMSSMPLENTNSEALQLGNCSIRGIYCESSTRSFLVKALAQTAPNGTEQEHHFDTTMSLIFAYGGGNVCFTPFSSARFGVSTCISVADIVARTNVSPIPSNVPRLVGKSCTKAQSVRTTQTGKLVCRSTSRGLVWRLSS